MRPVCYEYIDGFIFAVKYDVNPDINLGFSTRNLFWEFEKSSFHSMMTEDSFKNCLVPKEKFEAAKAEFCCIIGYDEQYSIPVEKM